MIIEFPASAMAENKAREAIKTLRTVASRIDPTRHTAHAALGLAAALRRTLDLGAMLERRLNYLKQCRIDGQSPAAGASLSEIDSIATSLGTQIEAAEDWLSSQVAGPMPQILQRDHLTRLQAMVCPAA